MFVIDEFPFLAKADDSFPSRLQHLIDHEWADTGLFLILCGSSMSFMEKEVLSEKSPLFGRRTAQFKIEPLSYLDTARFHPELSDQDNALIYGITGGVPHYINKLDVTGSIKDALLENLFDTSAYLFEEPENLLKQELREPALYNAIITAIANGASRQVEIADKAGMDRTACVKYMRVLQNLGIIRRIEPVVDKSQRKSFYRISDHFFRFWYRFVPRAAGAVERGLGSEYYDQAVAPFLHEYMGGIFEEMCREYVFVNGLSGKYDEIITNVGKWRGMDNLKKEPADIDVVGINMVDKKAVIGECKFRTARFGREDETKLMDRARLIFPYTVIQYMLFSAGGFTEQVIKDAEDKKVVCVKLEDMY